MTYVPIQFGVEYFNSQNSGFWDSLYVSVETIVGHARLARDGITRALSELVTDGYFSEQDAHETAQRIMRDNALEVFDFKGALAAWH